MAESEAAFRDRVVREARRLGWLVYWTHDSRRSPAGFPDLALCRERLLFRELKTGRAKTTPEQDRWLGALRTAEADAGVWRPEMWDEIVEELR